MTAPEFVAIGHVTLDQFGDATRPGGAALYAAITAHRLGLTVGLLTSHGDDFPLDVIPSRIEVVTVPAPQTTVFEHRADGARRSLRVRTMANVIAQADVPEDWAEARVALLAPVLDEVSPLIVTTFAGGAIAAAAQGYLRRRGPAGDIVPGVWASPKVLLGKVQALFLSREDVVGEPGSVIEWFQQVPVGALTAGRNGGQLFVNGESYAVRPRRVTEVDETGAGDVFAATFMIHYERDGDPWHAAAAAACAGALSVEGEGWSAVPERGALAAALAAYTRDE